MRDVAHTTDRVKAVLDPDSSGRCKGPVADTCDRSPLRREDWCAWCKAKEG